MRPYRLKWIFTPNELDEQIVREKMDRLIASCGAGVTITRADAIRALFHRAAEVDRLEREAELEALPGAQIGSMVASRELEKLRGT